MISAMLAPVFNAPFMWRLMPGAYIESDAQKLRLFRADDSAAVDASACSHELVGPFGVELEKRIPGRIPLTDLLHFVASIEVGRAHAGDRVAHMEVQHGGAALLAIHRRLDLLVPAYGDVARITR